MTSAPPKIRIRGMILTVGIAAVTMVGTFYGAGLKSDHDSEKQRKIMAVPTSSTSATSASAMSSTIPLPDPEDEFIAALQSRRYNLEQSRQSWEKKATALRHRMEASPAVASGK